MRVWCPPWNDDDACFRGTECHDTPGCKIGTIWQMICGGTCYKAVFKEQGRYFNRLLPVHDFPTDVLTVMLVELRASYAVIIVVFRN